MHNVSNMEIRTLEAQYEPEVHRCLIQHAAHELLLNSSYEATSAWEDRNVSCDARLTVNAMIGCRIRNHEYIRYNDMTIRAGTEFNSKTEIDKLKNGIQHIYFYGWLKSEADLADAWSPFARFWILRTRGIVRAIDSAEVRPRYNHDGTSFVTVTGHDLLLNNAFIYDSEGQYTPK